MSEKTIYAALIEFGMSPVGACAMLGNMMAESSLKANIAQRGMTKLTDAEYTAKFDGHPETCYRDGVGYGLAQWTYWSRKQNLFEFANARGKSVGDENTQIDFAVHELRAEYSGLYSYLCSTEDMYNATARICKEYERPAVNNIDRRFQFAQTFDRDFAGEVVAQNPAASFPPDQSILVLQAVLVANGYATEITGYKSVDFFEKLREFVHDIGG